MGFCRPFWSTLHGLFPSICDHLGPRERFCGNRVGLSLAWRTTRSAIETAALILVLGNRCSIRLSYGATRSYETLVVTLVALRPAIRIRSAATNSSLSFAQRCVVTIVEVLTPALRPPVAKRPSAASRPPEELSHASGRQLITRQGRKKGNEEGEALLVSAYGYPESRVEKRCSCTNC
jgi:hypothetical protein